MSGALAAGMIAGQLGASYMGNKAAGKASAKAAAEAAALRQQALAELSGLNPIELASLGYDPETIQFIQEAQPQLYGAPEDVQGNMISTDPKTRAAQMEVLSQLSDRAEEGLSAQDKYNFMKNRRDTESSARGQEMAIQENLRQRGMGGTGIEAAMRMMASQGGSDRLAQSQALQAAENANMRLNALGQQGALAGNIRGQDIGVAQSNADILNQLAWNNSERQRQIANMNIDMQNKAAQGNIQEQRNVQAVNADTRNQAQLINKQTDRNSEQLRQQSVHDIAKAKAGALTGGIPDIYAGGAADAANARGMWDTVGAGVGTAGSMYATQSAADKAAAQSAADRAADREMYKSIYGV